MDPSTIYSGLLERGFSPVQAAALAGNIQQESGFNPEALNKGEGAYGLIQWRLDRRDALNNFAASRGLSPNDPNAQLDFLKHEMTNGAEARSAAPFMAATDLASANAALRKYIRYGDDSQAQRLAYAQRFSDGQMPTPQPQQTAQAPMPLTPAAMPQQPAQAQPQMPAYGWSPQGGGMPSPQSPQMPPIYYAPRKPPDLSSLQAVLQRAPAMSRGFSFYKG